MTEDYQRLLKEEIFIGIEDRHITRYRGIQLIQCNAGETIEYRIFVFNYRDFPTTIVVVIHSSFMRNNRDIFSLFDRLIALEIYEKAMKKIDIEQRKASLKC